MKSYPFSALLSRMRYITRWGLMRAVRQENLAEHTAETAQLAHLLALLAQHRFGAQVEPQRVAVAALYHDAAEILTGDLPTPVKYSSELLKNAFSDKGIPVFIGECTSVKSYNDPGRIPDGAEYSDPLEIFKTELEIITDYGFVPVIWDTANDWYNRSELRFNNAEDGEAVLEIAEKISK